MVGERGDGGVRSRSLDFLHRAPLQSGLREVDLTEIAGANIWVAHVWKLGVVRVRDAFVEGHDVRIRSGVGFVLVRRTPHRLANVAPAGVHLVDALAPEGVLLRVAIGLREEIVLGVSVRGRGADAQLVCSPLARFVPRIAVGRGNGHRLNFPTVVTAVVVLAKLTQVVVAFVKATLFDEERLARA